MLYKKSPIDIKLTKNIDSYESLSKVYTPGVADMVQNIDINNKTSLTLNPVLVIGDSSAVLGFGKMHPLSGLPVLEAKAALYKRFANIPAIPLVLDNGTDQEIISLVKRLAINFSGIHLEDIASPRCFEITQQLNDCLDIPVVHDDQSCTAIAILAAMINLERIWECDISKLKVVICGMGAAGIATAKLLSFYGLKDIKPIDRNGLIRVEERGDFPQWNELAALYNPNNQVEQLKNAMVGANIFIGLSSADIITENNIEDMSNQRAVFALANPRGEISYERAIKVSKIVATGSSSNPNQINNAIVFPNYMRFLMKEHLKNSFDSQCNFARLLAKQSINPSENTLLPSIFDLKFSF